MGNCFLHGNGGSNPLNFKIVAYATEEELKAATPKENTIGIITAEKITSWTFATEPPAEPEEGMVIINVGTFSPVEFNALKKNGIQLYPLTAEQYVDSAWVSVTAMSYQNSKWSSWWNGELFKAGDQCVGVTGGWEALGFDLNGSWHPTVPTLEIGETMKVGFSRTDLSTFCGAAITKNKIDLTDWKTLKVLTKEIKLTKTCEYASGVSVRVLNSNDATNTIYDIQAATATIQSGTSAFTFNDVTTNLDVSALSGEYYIAVVVTLAPKSGGGDIYADISEIMLSKEAQ